MEVRGSVYPRPQFERNKWICLNGTWDFCFENEPWQKIQVPYVYQSDLSGIGCNRVCDRVTYKRYFSIPEDWKGNNICLNFGAVDYSCEIYINGQHVGGHTGGNIGFSLDITEALNWQEEEVVVRVYDPWNDETIPRGKQYWKEIPESIWYTRSTGIWQPVWLEPVPEMHIEGLQFLGDVDKGSIKISWRTSSVSDNCWIAFDISLAGEHVTSIRQQIYEPSGTMEIGLFGNHIFHSNFHNDGWCWTPENPTLFDIDVQLLEHETVHDLVHSYFGIRKVEAKNGIVYLNNKPYYQKLVLDQGYWPDGILTPSCDDRFKEDILKSKEMGFNGCRKHQKAEDPRFLYWADKLGYLVWGEIGSCISFSEQSVIRLSSEWTEAVRRDYNHPSIIAWVTINESWGVPSVARDKQQQALACALYYLCKALDPSRLVIGNDGWEMVVSDICAIHNYSHGNQGDLQAGDCFRKSIETRENLINGMPSNRTILLQTGDKDEIPVMITEFGGISLKCDKDKAWGYTQVCDVESFVSEYKRLLSAIGDSKTLCGFCYTQLYDVEQETNGLLTYDRKNKVSPETIKEINDKVCGFWKR